MMNQDEAGGAEKIRATKSLDLNCFHLETLDPLSRDQFLPFFEGYCHHGSPMLPQSQVQPQSRSDVNKKLLDSV